MTTDLGGYEEIKRRHRATNGSAEPPRLKPLLWSELSSTTSSTAIIKGLLDEGTMSVMYGASGSYKTFVAANLGAHVALGRDWCGRRVHGGRVLYIAAEGGGSIERRFTAFRIHHAIEPCDELAVLPVSVDLCHEASDVEEVINGARWVFQGEPLKLIIVDTLSRTFGGGNENAPDDMGGFVRNCDRLRHETGAHLLAIHHSGKDSAQGARGHSLLRAAVDTEIEVAKDETAGLITVTVTKQRDHQTGDRFAFNPIRIELGNDDDGDPVTSCILEPVGCAGAAKLKPKKIAPAAKQALDLLHEAMIANATTAPSSEHVPAGAQGVTKSVWRAFCEKGGIINPEGSPREQLRRIVVTLKDAGFIGVWDDFVWPVTQRHKASL
jgi:hypothetical protein